MMTPKRTYYLLLTVLILLVGGLVFGTYSANKLLESRSQKLTELKIKTLALQKEKQTLVATKKEIATYADLGQIARAVVPQDKDQAAAVRQIVKIAGANGVKLAAITFPASTLGGGAAASTAPTSASTAKTAGTPITQVQPVKNIAGVYDLQITVQSDSSKPVSFNQFIGFLKALEQNRRTAQVNSITISPLSSNRSLLTFTLNLDEYIKP